LMADTCDASRSWETAYSRKIPGTLHKFSITMAAYTTNPCFGRLWGTQVPA
jgi:hypothetical protein